MNRRKDPFGFLFWLKWILLFGGSFLGALLLWTWIAQYFFGHTTWPGEVKLSWAAAIFGSWFLTLTPFMRKKEQIWKRLNAYQEQAVDIWLTVIALLITAVIASCMGWAVYYRSELIAEAHAGPSLNWVKAVLGTLLLSVLPILIFLYRKAGILMKAAEHSVSAKSQQHQMIAVERSKRLLPESLKHKMKDWEPTLHSGHIVNLTLRDGRRIAYVFILNRSEVLGIYDKTDYDFEAKDITDVEPVAQDALPAYQESKWLRLDLR